MANSGIGKLDCFVAMPLTTPANYIDNLRDGHHFEHVLDHLFTPALTKLGYQVIAPKSRGAQLIHAEIIRNLEQADLVLCDLSSLNANVFFELGIRTSLDRPVALVKDRITERIPFDLSTINTHTYDESLTPWTLEDEIEQLVEYVKAVDTGTGSGNNLWRYFGLTKRATPAEIADNPTEAKLDLLLAEITTLRTQISDRQTEVREFASTSNSIDNRRVVAQWLADEIRKVTSKSPRFSLTWSDNAYTVTLSDMIAENIKQDIEMEALRHLGVRVRLIDDPWS